MLTRQPGGGWRKTFDDEMNRPVFTALAIIGTTLVSGWLVVSVYAKSRYDRIRQQEFGPAYIVAPMDREAEAFLSNVQSSWVRRADIVNGAEADMVKLTGKTPSVRNLIDLCKYKMPPYNWFSPAQNRKSATLGLLKALFPPSTVDKEWHVSKDVDLAMLCGTNRVYLYRDEGMDLRVTLYVKNKENIEPGASPDAAPPHR